MIQTSPVVYFDSFLDFEGSEIEKFVTLLFKELLLLGEQLIFIYFIISNIWNFILNYGDRLP